MRHLQAVPTQCLFARALQVVVIVLCAVGVNVENGAVAQPPNAPPAETLTFPDEPPATWLTYHLAHPGTTAPGDPNGVFFWNGRYHLHDIYEGPAGASWAHVSSPDMVHWKWHPTTLTPKTMGHGLFSGTGLLTKEGRPAIIDHGFGTDRNQIAIAEDAHFSCDGIFGLSFDGPLVLEL